MLNRPITPRERSPERGKRSGPSRAGRPEAGRSTAHLRAVHGLATRLNRLNDVGQIGEAIAAELRDLVDYHNCRVYLLQADGRTVLPIAFQGDVDLDPTERIAALTVKVGEGITGRVVQTGQTYVTGNARFDSVGVDIPGTPDIDESIVAAPMQFDDHVMGAIVLSQLGVDRFDEHDGRLLEVMASIAAIAFENVRRFQQLEEAYLSTIEALANALEAKDEYTSDHARALAEMSIEVGAELGLPGERLRKLELAALFHDIGKIGVRSEIIRKPGPLTAAERREMQRHPEIGEQILAPVPFLREIRPIVRACHERWDGKGYPDRLAGPEIPLEARIIFVCDAFDAMTTTRPYRAALPVREAVRRLKLASGSQFDRAVVGVFLQVHLRGGFSGASDGRRATEAKTG